MNEKFDGANPGPAPEQSYPTRDYFVTGGARLGVRPLPELIKKIDQAHVFADNVKVPADQVQVGGDHYKNMDVEPWAVMGSVLTHAEFVGFLKGNIIKYSMRIGKKVGATEDGDKVKHFMRKLQEVQANGAT